MPRALVILPSTTYRATDFMLAAEGLGVDLVVASDQPPPVDMGDRYLTIDCADALEAAAVIVDYSDSHRVDAVVAADDRGVLVAALAGTRLGLDSNLPHAAAATRNKALQRRMLNLAEVPQPRFGLLGPDEEPVAVARPIGYPVVVKPVDRSASQGVIRADDPDELQSAVTRARQIVGGRATLLIEEYAPGAEIAVEGLIQDGELQILAFLDKPDTPSGPYFPETLLVTPSTLEPSQLEEVERVARESIKALGLSHGPCHIEMRVDADRVKVLEVAGRSIGGLCSQSLSFGLGGTTLEALILRNALGMSKPELKLDQSASGVLMIPTPSRGRLVAVENLDRITEIPEVTGVEMTAAPGAELAPPPEGDRYLGFVFARHHQRQRVIDALREAAGIINVHMESVENAEPQPVREG